MTRSLHDNFVLGYTVDAENNSILIRTEEPMEFILRTYAEDFEWGTKWNWPWINADTVSPMDHVTSLGAKRLSHPVNRRIRRFHHREEVRDRGGGRQVARGGGVPVTVRLSLL